MRIRTGLHDRRRTGPWSAFVVKTKSCPIWREATITPLKLDIVSLSHRYRVKRESQRGGLGSGSGEPTAKPPKDLDLAAKALGLTVRQSVLLRAGGAPLGTAVR